MKPTEYRVSYQQAAPKVIWLTIDGVHFPLTNEIAFVYNWSRSINGEEMTNDLLRPQIMSARAAWIANKNGILSPENAVQIAR